jgi:hypothetical protein
MKVYLQRYISGQWSVVGQWTARIGDIAGLTLNSSGFHSRVHAP